MIGAGPFGNIGKEFVRVAGREINVPVECLAETGSSLILGARPVRVEDMYIDQAGQFAEKRRVVLNRMGGEDGDSCSRHWLDYHCSNFISSGRTIAQAQFQSNSIRQLGLA